MMNSQSQSQSQSQSESQSQSGGVMMIDSSSNQKNFKVVVRVRPPLSKREIENRDGFSTQLHLYSLYNPLHTINGEIKFQISCWDNNDEFSISISILTIRILTIRRRNDD